jgi:hypothetical protein
MLTKPLLTASLSLTLATMSATAHAGWTITDKDYWPNEVQQSAHVGTNDSQNALGAGFSYDRPALWVEPQPDTDDGGFGPRYEGGPKAE